MILWKIVTVIRWIWSLCFSYILKVPFDSEDNQGIVYVWIGDRANPEEARVCEEIAEDMFGVGYLVKFLQSCGSIIFIWSFEIYSSICYVVTRFICAGISQYSDLEWRRGAEQFLLDWYWWKEKIWKGICCLHCDILSRLASVHMMA